MKATRKKQSARLRQKSTKKDQKLSRKLPLVASFPVKSRDIF